ncbi:hypothetical protein [Streptomyces sp. NPDC093544]|uniref:hypothetical protein n=1 Tax=Streptomyces sp. NPDC093544 TaxID=3155200 RepID=UPI0034379102
MTDAYRDLAAPEPFRPEPDTSDETAIVRPLLWTLLLLGAVANMVTSSVGGFSVYVGIGLGVLTLGCAVALAVHHRVSTGGRS